MIFCFVLHMCMYCNCVYVCTLILHYFLLYCICYVVCVFVLQYGRMAVAEYCNYKSNQINVSELDCNMYVPVHIRIQDSTYVHVYHISVLFKYVRM